MTNYLISIIFPVLNGEKYIRHCLEAVLAQTDKSFELTIVDDGSTDSTLTVISNFQITSSKQFPNLKLQITKNIQPLGPWGNFEKQIRVNESKYCLLLCVDVIIDKDFIKNALAIMEADERIGCLQAKIYQYELGIMNNVLGVQKNNSDHDTLYPILDSNLIDTCGFQISKSRRVTNVGHGQIDNGKFDKQQEIFAVEGAVPFYRREAFLDCEIAGEIVDREMFWYGDDLDMGWRMNLFGWKQVYTPKVVAYHDRSTTKGMSYHWWNYLARIKTRRQIPIRKRRLDWRNKRLARIKNDQWPNVLRHLPQILLREFSELIYIILIEPSVLLEMFNLVKLWPKMLNKRRVIMARAKRSAEEMKEWFI